MTLLIALFAVGIGIPTLIALGVSWHEVTSTPLPLVHHAPRARLSATVILYHTNNSGTIASLRALRRIRAANLAIIIVVPTGVAIDVNVPATVAVLHKQRPASRELTLASCYRLLASSDPVCIIDSGDIMTAPMLHTALAAFRQSTQHWLLYAHTTPLARSFTGVLLWFERAMRHTGNLLRTHSPRKLPSGTWLRRGSQLRTPTTGPGQYIPTLRLDSLLPPRLEPLGALGVIGALSIIAIAAPCYVAAAQLHSSLPLISFWAVATWWSLVLIGTAQGKLATRLTPILCAPLAGILVPVWCSIMIGITLQRYWQRLARTRHQYTEHRIFFSLRHP